MEVLSAIQGEPQIVGGVLELIHIARSIELGRRRAGFPHHDVFHFISRDLELLGLLRIIALETVYDIDWVAQES